MGYIVKYTKDPNLILNEAERFLNTDPVQNNLILTILKYGVDEDKVGGYWIVYDGSNVVGVCVQPHVGSRGITSSMPFEAVQSLVEDIVVSNIHFTGIGGEVSVTANFAGEWGEKNKSPVIPFLGLRLYKLECVKPITSNNGYLRNASSDNRELLVDWLYDFTVEIGVYQESSDPQILLTRKNETSEFIDRNISAGNVWLWENEEPVSMVIRTPEVYGVVRLEKIYTPAEQRNMGYATSCVGQISEIIHNEGYQCILYTDLNNPVSNTIYRKIGYNAIAEILQYRFE
ncbi:hypothetical protein C6497_15360 [Candidatus Poribacteria bacterium]|nr:MAG: hypothetical protein C6497_15360 [Candidatus Poribacteria bacterium]